VDEFLGDNAGLVVAEVELDAPTSVRAAGLGRRRSHRAARYYNLVLASRPYSQWTPAEQRGGLDPARLRPHVWG
jgi:adenylate cyclase